MERFFKDITAAIKSRTKEDWISEVNSVIRRVRSYIQENAEVSFVIAFVLGILIVVLFRIVFSLAVIFALFAGVIFCIAESESERRAKNSPPRAAKPSKDKMNGSISNGTSSPEPRD